MIEDIYSAGQRAPPSLPFVGAENETTKRKIRRKGKIKMPTYIEAKVFENPDPGEHVAVLADVIDLGTVHTVFGDKSQVKLVFLTDQNGDDGKPLQVHVRLGKTRWKTGNLIKYVRAFCSPGPITSDSWLLDGHIGKCVGLDLVHVQKDEMTFCNVERVFPLGKTAKKLTIPLSFQRREDSDGTAFAQPQPPAAPAYPAVDPYIKPKIKPAPTSAATRAAAVQTELAKRSKAPREPFATGQEEEQSPPLT